MGQAYGDHQYATQHLVGMKHIVIALSLSFFGEPFEHC